MSSTTIRIDTATHAQLVELSQATGQSLIDTVRDATEALRRARFGQQVASEFAELQADSAAWDAYTDQAERTSVADGIG